MLSKHYLSISLSGSRPTIWPRWRSIAIIPAKIPGNHFLLPSMKILAGTAWHILGLTVGVLELSVAADSRHFAGTSDFYERHKHFLCSCSSVVYLIKCLSWLYRQLALISISEICMIKVHCHPLGFNKNTYFIFCYLIWVLLI
jgi:hypothetical protein